MSMFETSIDFNFQRETVKLCMRTEDGMSFLRAELPCTISAIQCTIFDFLRTKQRVEQGSCGMNDVILKKSFSPYLP